LARGTDVEAGDAAGSDVEAGGVEAGDAAGDRVRSLLIHVARAARGAAATAHLGNPDLAAIVADYAARPRYSAA
jgi:hypothetical protein